MKKFIILIILFMSLSAFNINRKDIFTRSELNKIFNDYVDKQIYYSGKFLEALNVDDFEMIKLYNDSIQMTNHKIIAIYDILNPKK
jgi:hypothetical protein